MYVTTHATPSYRSRPLHSDLCQSIKRRTSIEMQMQCPHTQPSGANMNIIANVAFQRKTQEVIKLRVRDTCVA